VVTEKMDGSEAAIAAKLAGYREQTEDSRIAAKDPMSTTDFKVVSLATVRRTDSARYFEAFQDGKVRADSCSQTGHPGAHNPGLGP
jgi:hypothetical protein